MVIVRPIYCEWMTLVWRYTTFGAWILQPRLQTHKLRRLSYTLDHQYYNTGQYDKYWRRNDNCLYRGRLAPAQVAMMRIPKSWCSEAGRQCHNWCHCCCRCGRGCRAVIVVLGLRCFINTTWLFPSGLPFPKPWQMLCKQCWDCCNLGCIFTTAQVVISRTRVTKSKPRIACSNAMVIMNAMVLLFRKLGVLKQSFRFTPLDLIRSCYNCWDLGFDSYTHMMIYPTRMTGLLFSKLRLL